MPFETQITLASSPKASPRFLHSQLSSASQHLPAGHRPFLHPSQTLPSEHGCVSVWVLLQSRWQGAEVPWHTKDRSGRRGCPCSPLAAPPYRVPACPSPCVPLPPGLTWVPPMGSRAHGAPTSYPWPIRGSQTEPSPAHCRVHPLRGRRGSKTNSFPDTDVKYPAQDLPYRALGLFFFFPFLILKLSASVVSNL